MDGLCSKLNNKLSKQSIYRYESGKTIPDSTKLIMIAKVLNMDIDYFFRPFTVDSDNLKISFKKNYGIKKEKLNALKKYVCDTIERYNTIENILGMKNTLDYSIDEEIYRDSEVVAQAHLLRSAWNLGRYSIANVQELLENHGIKVIIVEDLNGLDGIGGRTDLQEPFIVLNGKDKSVEELRFNALHELAHILFDECFSVSLSERERENLCNVFASEMLMPSQIFLYTVGNSRKDISLQELSELQANYGVSIDSLMEQAQRLKVISENRYKVYNKKKEDTSFRADVEKSRYVEPKTRRFKSLVYKALASDAITISLAASLLSTSVYQIYNELRLV